MRSPVDQQVTASCYHVSGDGIRRTVDVVRNVMCSNPAHIPLDVTQHGHAAKGSWCVECPDGKENVWYEDTSQSIKCGSANYQGGVAPTAKVRATLGNVLAPVSVSSAPVQYADAIVEDCTSTDAAFCGSYCRGEGESTQAIEDATAVPIRTRLTPLSILNSTAPEVAAWVETTKPAEGCGDWGSPTYLGGQHCRHDTENWGCSEGEASCTCVCRKCPDGFSKDHSHGVRCLRCVCSFSSSGVVGARLVCLYSVSRSPWGAARVLES